MYSAPEVIERSKTPNGEIQLQRRGDHYEIISNGTFLMATYNGMSERLLVKSAIAAASAPERVMIGGLGVGFSLAEALSYSYLQNVVVIEVERKVIEWNQTHLASYSNSGLEDPRTQVIEADLIQWIHQSRERFDVICLDIDNGPDWTVTESNNELYKLDNLRVLSSLLAPKGAIAFWSAARAGEFSLKLKHIFNRVLEHPVPQSRGEPDYIYVAYDPSFP